MDKTINFWNKQAKKYDLAEKQFDEFYKEVFSIVETYLDVNDIVLDYGCATGTKTETFAKFTKHVCGLDISPEMIKIAEKKVNEKNIKNIKFVSGTIFNNDFSDYTFDKIIAFAIIHLLENAKDVVNKIYELLKPGGLFISTTACIKDKMPVKTRMVFLLYSTLKKFRLFPLHLNRFTTADVENLFDSSKFEILKKERLFLGMTISFIIARKI